MSEVSKVESLLAPSKFVKISMSDKFKWKTPSRICTIVQSDTISMTGNGRQLFSFDVLKDSLKFAEEFIYMDLLGITLTGQWLLPKGTPGAAEVILLDSRLKGRASVLSVFKCVAADQEFQFLLKPGYSIACEDAKKSPFELVCNVTDLPVKQGFVPLSVEIACLVQFSNCVLTRSLTRKLGSKPNEKQFAVEEVDELMGSMTTLKQIEGLRRTKKDVVDSAVVQSYKVGKDIRPLPSEKVGRANSGFGPKKTKKKEIKVDLNKVRSGLSDMEFSDEASVNNDADSVIDHGLSYSET
ncbi:unnamed protein product [Clitoria yellow mottle virus]|uniref:Movement protein n=1 Tax=Clitoria yellow mottle virus TaxID=1128119 RepID=G9I489_9VIRU|nr:unnamed protein product [Clitoria yellow mottle virus]AEW50166.1 movement protein [Clitoria yellow mottle virus]